MNVFKAVVIDDDPTVLLMIRRILERRNYDVRTYGDPGQSPLYSCKTCPCSLHDSGCPDLIISDFNMPLMNGAELLEGNQKKGCRCRHIALVSGEVIPESDLNRMAKYGTRFFIKPIDFGDFYDWLSRVEIDGIKKQQSSRVICSKSSPPLNRVA